MAVLIIDKFEDVRTHLDNRKLLHHVLPARSLRLSTLDSESQIESIASGFVVEINEKTFLVTCWHVVTGFDFLQEPMKTPNPPPDRRVLRVTGSDFRMEGTLPRIIGEFEVDVSLFDDDGNPNWLQIAGDDEKVKNQDLDTLKIEIPNQLDAVIIPIDLPDRIRFLWAHRITEDVDKHYCGRIWDTVLLSGYPYGYSSSDYNVSPVFLKRMIASASYGDSISCDVLLDGTGAAGMSGCPVYTEELQLCGIYRGILFPDYGRSSRDEPNDRHAALGLISPMFQHLSHLIFSATEKSPKLKLKTK